MIEIQAELKQWGNSYGLRIPKSVAEKAGLTKGDSLVVSLKKKRYDLESAFGMWKGTAPFKRERGLLDRF